MAALDAFHPESRRWFLAAFGKPTEVQRRSWPRIAAGEHLLVTAPTGSGKIWSNPANRRRAHLRRSISHRFLG